MGGLWWEIETNSVSLFHFKLRYKVNTISAQMDGTEIKVQIKITCLLPHMI
jgi:hypothetical protein